MAMKLSERRSGLDALLRSIVKQRCGSENVYYQPPANLRMKYPCICYKLEKSAAQRLTTAYTARPSIILLP